MSREDLRRLNGVLNRFTDANVKLRQSEKTEALDLWQPIVGNIVEKVKERDARFARIQIFPTGSYYERAKVGEPDEFDLMLVMDNLELDDDPYEEEENDGMSEPPTGESYTMYTMTFIVLSLPAREHDCLISFALFVSFVSSFMTHYIRLYKEMLSVNSVVKTERVS